MEVFNRFFVLLIMGVVSVQRLDCLKNHSPQNSMLKIDPSIFPATKVPVCLSYEDFRHVKLQDAFEESRLFKAEKTNFKPALCEGYMKRVAESFRINSTTCQKCGKSTSCSKKKKMVKSQKDWSKG